MSPVVIPTERTIPLINVSIEDDNDCSSEDKYQKKKNFSTINSQQQGLIGEDIDQDNEINELNRLSRRLENFRNDPTNLSSNECQETSASNSYVRLVALDNENLLAQKQSKIGMSKSK